MAEGTQDGGGAGDAGGGGEWTSAVPEAIRGHEALKGVKDVGDLAGRYVTALTPKPFADTLPEDIRADAAFKDIKDLAGLAKSYHSAQKMIGVPKDQLLRLPTDDKPESWAPIYDRLGRPAKADDYKMPTPPEGVKVDPEFQKELRAVAHAEGLTQKQLEKLVTWHDGSVSKALAKLTADQAGQSEKAAADLKAEWGDATDQRLSLAKQTLQHYSKELKLGDQLAIDLEKTNLGNHPGIAKLFAHLGAQMQEDGILGKASGSETLLAPTEARQHIAAKQTDAQFMKRYNNKSDPGHKAAVEEMAALYAKAYPVAA